MANNALTLTITHIRTFPRIDFNQQHKNALYLPLRVHRQFFYATDSPSDTHDTRHAKINFRGGTLSL